MTGQERCAVPGCGGAVTDGGECTTQLSRERVRALARQRLNGTGTAVSFEQSRALASRVRRVLDSHYGYATPVERLAAVDMLLTRVGFPAGSDGAS